jgi:hypothetical protein
MRQIGHECVPGKKKDDLRQDTRKIAGDRIGMKITGTDMRKNALFMKYLDMKGGDLRLDTKTGEDPRRDMRREDVLHQGMRI